MINIFFCGNWDSDEIVRRNFLRYTQNGNGIWNQLQVVEKLENADFLVVVNHPYQNMEFPKEKIIRMFYEPKDARKHWGPFSDEQIHQQGFLCVHDTCVCCWYLSCNYHYLKSVSPVKSKLFSSVISGKIETPYGEIRTGRQQRIKFAQLLSNVFGSNYEHYGEHHNNSDILDMKSYCGSLENKEDGLFPFQYSYASENTFTESKYCTEKLYDCILSECLCFYAGSFNLDVDIDPRSYIPIDISEPEAAVATIQAAIENDEYTKRYPYIQATKRKILDELQIFPTIERIFAEKNDEFENDM